MGREYETTNRAVALVLSCIGLGILLGVMINHYKARVMNDINWTLGTVVLFIVWVLARSIIPGVYEQLWVKNKHQSKQML